MVNFFETLGSINPLRPDNMARTGLETVQGIREIKDLLDQGKEREAYARFEQLPLQTQMVAYSLPVFGQGISGLGSAEYSKRAEETEGLERAGNVAIASLELASAVPLIGLVTKGISNSLKKGVKGIKENNSPTKIKEYYEANEKKQYVDYEPPKEVAGKFQKLANAQRGEPEIKMVTAQRNLMDVASGIYPFYLEHVGDLTNRLSDMYKGMSTDMPFHDVIPKIKKTSFHNSGDELYKEIIDNVQNNLKYAKENNKLPQDFSVEDALKLIKKEGQEYADKHKALEVFNEPQYLAREAAVALGEFRLNDYDALIKSLKKMSQSEELYEQGSKYFTDANNKIISYDDVLAATKKTKLDDLQKQLDTKGAEQYDKQFFDPELQEQMQRISDQIGVLQGLPVRTKGQQTMKFKSGGIVDKPLYD